MIEYHVKDHRATATVHGIHDGHDLPVHFFVFVRVAFTHGKKRGSEVAPVLPQQVVACMQGQKFDCDLQVLQVVQNERRLCTDIGTAV